MVGMLVTQHGGGFVGSAMAGALAYYGEDVAIVEIDTRKTNELSKLGFSVLHPSAAPLYKDRSIHIFSLPTPNCDKTAYPYGYDLGLLTAGLEFFAENVLRTAEEFKVVVMRSTLLPGTSEEVVIPLLEKHSGKRVGIDFGYIFNPEFLRQETAKEDALHPPLILYATSDEHSAAMFERMCLVFSCPVYQVDSFQAVEHYKLINNVLNAAVITVGNLSSAMLTCYGMPKEEIKALHLLLTKTAFAKTECNYGLMPGGPFGGACLPKEVRAMAVAEARAGIPGAASVARALDAFNNWWGGQYDIRFKSTIQKVRNIRAA